MNSVSEQRPLNRKTIRNASRLLVSRFPCFQGQLCTVALNSVAVLENADLLSMTVATATQKPFGLDDLNDINLCWQFVFSDK